MSGLSSFPVSSVSSFGALSYAAEELENPFGDDDGDLDMRQGQRELNSLLLHFLPFSSIPFPRLCVSVETAERQTSTVAPLGLARVLSGSASIVDAGILRVPGFRGSVGNRTVISATASVASSDCSHHPTRHWRVCGFRGPVENRNAISATASGTSADFSNDHARHSRVLGVRGSVGTRTAISAATPGTSADHASDHARHGSPRVGHESPTTSLEGLAGFTGSVGQSTRHFVDVLESPRFASIGVGLSGQRGSDQKTELSSRWASTCLFLLG